mgnify:CR=1 FL=1
MWIERAKGERLSDIRVAQAAATGADHVLRGLEHVATRLMHTVTPTLTDGGVPPRLQARLELDRDERGS